MSRVCSFKCVTLPNRRRASSEVKRQLFVQIAIEPPPVDDGDEAVPECLSVHRSRFFTKSEETRTRSE
ncbi:MAG: hypothetical protein DMF98_11135 [Acidobacteria bacterium]|nr:MAG: hypothetical protein DMF98_11135 [Acidobacteriota bacterium]